MTIFRLKDFKTLPELTRGGMIRWEFDRAEIIADGVVHILGIVAGLIAAAALIVLTSLYATAAAIASVSVYASGLLAMLVLSAIYNLWPVSPAATYTPFMTEIDDRFVGNALLIGVWSVAAFGIVLKIFFPGRFDRLSVVLYLAMGWSGVMAYSSLVESLPTSTLCFIAAGGLLYSLGVIFHAWERLRFQNAIWHSFVLVAASLHYVAVLDLVLISS